MTFDGIGWGDVAETLVGWLAFFSFLVGVAALQALIGFYSFCGSDAEYLVQRRNAANPKGGTWAARKAT
jgi:hypothetical protein